MMWEKLKSIIHYKTKITKQYASFYEVYLQQFDKIDANKFIQNQSFVVLDTETTGLSMIHDNIISIGAVRIVNNNMDISDSLSIIVKNDQIQSHEAIKIHGLVNNELKGQSAHVVLDKFFHYVGSDIIVGHHIGFDIAMLNKFSKNNGGDVLKNSTLDTSALARRLDHPSNPESLDRKDYTLDKLCTRFNVLPKARHTADGDAFITAIIFMKLLQKLSLKGITTVGQLLK